MRKEFVIVVGILLITLGLFHYKRGTIVEEQLEISTSTTTIADSYMEERLRMVERDLKSRDINDKKVLEVMSKVPRHEFVSENVREQAYDDYPLPIGYGQTISQPYMVALMTQELGLKGDEKVLEIGTGSGYQAAVLAELVPEVYTIEIVPELAGKSNESLRRLGYENVHVMNADGYFGWPEKVPFDAIIITAAVEFIPPLLLEQLKDGGKLMLPLGSTRYYQTLTVVEKNGDELNTRYITGCVFVPMTGEVQRR